MLAGPIKHWWGSNWMTRDHLLYDHWRGAVCEELVAAGYLVYRPHEAFKGTWSERAQPINNIVISVADVVLNLSPPEVPSVGTGAEVAEAERIGKRVLLAPPPPSRLGDEAVAEYEKAGLEHLVRVLSGIAKAGGA